MFFAAAARVAGRQSVLRPSATVGMVSASQRRYLNLQEYVSKDLMAKYGVDIQRGQAADTPAAAQKAASALASQTKKFVVKAQILAGGRGKGTFVETGYRGGVHLVDTPAEVAAVSKEMLGKRLVTHQTPPSGIPVNKVLVAECIDIKRELYLAVLLDRGAGGPVFVASTKGGMDIEAVAATNPSDILTMAVHPIKGPQRAQCLDLARKLGFSGALAEKAATQMENVYKMFVDTDATQIEINPWAETPDGRVVTCDAKLGFDDSAKFRQRALFDLEDTSESDPREVAAAKHELNYVGLDGNIGCMVNGAGLAMSTMDIIQLHGGMPANFLDVGGGATTKQVVEAFKILTADPKVKAILVNIFGGIMRCDVIAEGIITAAKQVGLNLPLVVRLEGTNVKKGNQMLQNSGLPIITATDLDDAAIKAVATLK